MFGTLRMLRKGYQAGQPATVFVAGPVSDGIFAVRYFTVRCEVPMCGHASLAVGHALWSTRRLPSSVDQITLLTVSTQKVPVSNLGGNKYSIGLATLPYTELSLNLSAKVRESLAACLSTAATDECDSSLEPCCAASRTLLRGVSFVGRNEMKDVLVVVSSTVFTHMTPTPAALFSVFPDSRIISITTRGGWSHPSPTLKLPPASGFGALQETAKPDGDGPLKAPLDAPLEERTGSDAPILADAERASDTPSLKSAANYDDTDVRVCPPPHDVAPATPAGGGARRWWEAPDVISRCFNAAEEDAVCAAAHAGIAAYWVSAAAATSPASSAASPAAATAATASASPLQPLQNKVQFRAFQSSSRGGTLFCTVDDAQVHLAGLASSS